MDDFKDASFRPDRSVGTLIQNAPHLAGSLGGAVARGTGSTFNWELSS